MKNKPYEKEPNTCNIPQVAASLYRTEQYNDKRRFISYWHQIHETSIHSSGKILEVGKGNGFVSNFLKEMGKDLITLDIDIKLNPDICASVTKLPFKNNAFDTITCFEILEHLPFEKFVSTLSELKRVSTKYCLISLPDCRPYYRIYLQIPKIVEIKHLFVPFIFRKPKHFFTGEHYWEIGKANYPVKRILKKIENAGFRIIEHYRVYETPYHHFFILETKK
jgi:ubiquinone/menaquinone biosynthesis C-methylase UbiE